VFHEDEVDTETCVSRQLCIYVDARSVYCTLSEILHDNNDKLAFASHMVQVLNMILFTASELYDLRSQLKDLAAQVSSLTAIAVRKKKKDQNFILTNLF